MKNLTPAPGAAQLIAGIDARVRELDKQGHREYERFRELSAQMQKIGKHLTEMEEEIKALEKLRRGYLNNSRPKAERKPRRVQRAETITIDDDPRPGATDTVLGLMRATDQLRMTRDEATKRLEDAIRAGAVRTNSTDPLKMAGTTIGNMIRTGYLKQEGNEVVLLLTSRKRKGRPTES